jgi:hypothetical protein
VTRADVALAYDSNRGLVVLFGGADGKGVQLAETWEYDGQAWTQATPTTSPPATASAATAFDPVRQRVVIFGGSTPATTSNETWEYDGATWVLKAPATIPPARTQAAMTYDASRHRIVMFGGSAGSTSLSDTWEYDGTNWSQVLASGPSARTSAVLSYDPARGRSILFGGSSPDVSFLADTWEFDGTSWRSINTSSFPPGRKLSAAVYDPIIGATMLYGGLTASGTFGDTWMLAWSSGTFPAEACIDATLDTDADGRVGCADPDCWGRCTPGCPPRTSCDTALPRCGDGNCAAVEDYVICPADCTAP